MSWKHWAAVSLVIGLGIVWQIPQDDELVEERRRPEQTAAPPESDDAPPARSDTPGGPYRTIALEVTGMT